MESADELDLDALIDMERECEDAVQPPKPVVKILTLKIVKAVNLLKAVRE